MDEWIKIVLGLVSAAALGLSAWLLKLAHDLDKRVTVLERQPKIDPVEQAKAMTQLAMSIAQLTSQLADNNRSRNEQYLEMKKMHEEFRKELDEVRSDVKFLVAIRKQTEGLAR